MASLKLSDQKEAVIIIKDHERQDAVTCLHGSYISSYIIIELTKQQLTVKHPAHEYRCFIPLELLDMFTSLFDSVRALRLGGAMQTTKYPRLRVTLYIVENIFDGIKFDWFNNNGGVVLSNTMQVWEGESWEEQ